MENIADSIVKLFNVDVKVCVLKIYLLMILIKISYSIVSLIHTFVT